MPSGRANGLPARVRPLDVALGGLPAQVGDARGGHAVRPAEAVRALGALRAGELHGAAALAWLGLGSGLGLRLGLGLGLRLGLGLGSRPGAGQLLPAPRLALALALAAHLTGGRPVRGRGRVA